MRYLYVFLILLLPILSNSQNNLPNIDLRSINGENVTLHSQLNQGGTTIISLWATWCVPCLKELDAISEVYEDWQEETSVRLLAISIDDSRTLKRVKPLINGKDWDYTVLLDTNSDLKRALNASNIPLTLIVKDKKIVYEHMSYVPGAENELYEQVKALSN